MARRARASLRVVSIGSPWSHSSTARLSRPNRSISWSSTAAAAAVLDQLIDRFGRDNLAVELWDHGDPIDTTRNDALALLAIHPGVSPVATDNVPYATPA